MKRFYFSTTLLLLIALAFCVTHAGETMKASYEKYDNDYIPTTLIAMAESIDIVKNNYEAEPEEQQELLDNKELAIDDILFIGDSNTVRMNMFGVGIANAKDIAAIVGTGLNGFNSYTNKENTTNGKSLKEYLDTLDSSVFDNVVIMLGTNDYANSVKDNVENYIKVLEYIKDRNINANIYIVTIPPVNDAKSPSIKNRDVVRFNNEVIREIDIYCHVIYTSSVLSASDMSNVKGDGYHFNKSGAQKAFDYIMQSINEQED